LKIAEPEEKRKHLEYEDLVSEGKLRKEKEIKTEHVKKLIRLSFKDLETSRFLIEKEIGAALIILYNAAFRSTNALIRSQGYRPGRRQQHIGSMEAVKRTLKDELQSVFEAIDDLRIKRNNFKYKGILDLRKNDLRKTLGDVEKFIKAIASHIQENNSYLDDQYGDQDGSHMRDL
jgi:uncharacterized protein (UPF0332 family)